MGHDRSRKAQHKLFDYTGYAMLTYTTKNDENGFAPVGEEMLLAKIVRGNEAVLVLCDVDGYTKAQSKPLPAAKANEIYLRMQEDGFAEYRGEVKTVS
jgi:hypothetical protein